jgi:hypothetical protein
MHLLALKIPSSLELKKHFLLYTWESFAPKGLSQFEGSSPRV